jgi:hypothetical protein
MDDALMAFICYYSFGQFRRYCRSSRFLDALSLLLDVFVRLRADFIPGDFVARFFLAAAPISSR